MANKISIITYHYVRNLKHSRHPQIKGLDINLFKEQLNYILKYYGIIRMQDLFEAIGGNKKLPENSLLLTFDDGYIDHFESAFPILDELGIQGSFFPPGKAICEHKVLDVNKIHFILASVEDKKLLIENIYSLMDKYRKEFNLEPNDIIRNKLITKSRFDAEEVSFIKKILQKALPEKLRNIIVDNLFFKYVSKDEAAFSRELYMDADQLKYMTKHGMYVGGHGWDHYWLDTLSEDQQNKEIELSLKFLETIGCDTSAWAMCYPYGAYNDFLIALLKSRGCKLALTAEVGIADLTAGNPFILPRLDANDLPKDENAEPNEWTLKVISGGS
ncbi:MAG: polysaccharide deacetylase family protein [Patescibacteria group bacterium]